MLVAHGHDVLHIGGEGHTGHTILVAQHLRHLSLLLHVPDAYSWSVPVLGGGEAITITVLCIRQGVMVLMAQGVTLLGGVTLLE